MKKSHVIVLAVSLLTLVAGVVWLAVAPQTSSGQQQFPDATRKIACGCYCGGSTPDYFLFSDTKDCAGILAADACNTELPRLPAAQFDAMCKSASEKRKGSCPVLRELCSSRKPDPDSKCENKPTPWFDRSTPCTDVQSPQVTLVGSEVKLSFCGFPIFRFDPPADKDQVMREAYVSVLKEWLQQTVGTKVCCSSFRKSMQTGQPCNPAVDIDCDGKPNQTDVNTTYSSVPVPAIDLYTSPAGSPIDPFPAGLNPDDPNFLPNTTARDSKGVGECACKWELIRGNLKCSPDGQQQHVYVATWRCPSNKTEVMTTKYAPATAPCSKGSSKALLLLDYRLALFGE